jgi:hypothetical protein
MSAAKRLVLIALGYAFSVAGGVGLVAVNELSIPADVAQTSGGMVAFGDMIVFVLGTGFFSLVPTWFLLKLAIERVPSVLLTTLLVLAVIGPLSWLAVDLLARGPVPNPALSDSQFVGLLIAFGAIPRIVAGPVLLVVEGVAIFLTKARLTRALLAGAMLMDVIPLGLYALHFASVSYR